MNQRLAVVTLILFLVAHSLAMVLSFMILNHQNTYPHTKNHVYRTLTFTQETWSQVVFVKKNEIRLQQGMFDIRSVKHTEKGVEVYGHYDHKEDLLRKAQSKHDDEKKSQKNFSSVFQGPLMCACLPQFRFGWYIHEKLCYKPFVQPYRFSLPDLIPNPPECGVYETV
jgi:hypothetical protein